MLALSALVGCGSSAGQTPPSSPPPSNPLPAHPQATAEEASRGTVVVFARSWEGWDDPTIGCVPFGSTTRLRGVLRVRPFGRKGRGTELVLEGGEALVVAYGETDQHRELEGVPVIATGRYCTKQLQAVSGQHFDIETLTLPE